MPSTATYVNLSCAEQWRFTLSDLLPGWSDHGGGGDGNHAGNDGNDENRYLELNAFDASRTHNRLYVPSAATVLTFSYQRSVAGTDDQLEVRLDGSLLGSVTLNATDLTTFQTESFPIGPELHGQVHTLTFAIAAPGPLNVVDSEVRIDNVRFSTTVTGTSPSLESGTLVAGTAWIQINFSDPVLGGGTADNYQLQGTGPDGLLGTADDLQFSLDAAYSGTQATLSFTNLSTDTYRLTVRDSITDAGGNPLDGDADGEPGGDWATEFVVVPPDSGVFATGATYPTGNGDYVSVYPCSIATADFNGDGIGDLVAANYGSDNVTLLAGDGAGGFRLSGTYPSGGSNPISVTVADFNGDGKTDLAVANQYSDNVGVLLGNGSGGFAAVVTYRSGGSYPHSVAVGDFNGDGKDDFAVANLGSNNVGILLGNGSGGFATTAITHDSGGLNPCSVTVGDFNGDGKDDLAIANYGSNNVGILLGNGSGGFATTAITCDSGGLNPYSVTVGDFDDDGKSDVAVANSGSDNVGVLLRNASGGFATAVTRASGGSSPYSVTVGDFNGDGRTDLAVANSGSANVGVLLGNGSGGFATAVTRNSGFSDPYSVTAGDFNDDGDTDLAVANYYGNNVGVLLGNGSGGFATTVTYASGGGLPHSVTVGDFNGDGKDDLAVANNESHNVGVVLGNGSGAFATPITYPTGGVFPISVTVGDFNADGKSDLAVANYWSDNVGVLLGNDAGGFATAVTRDSGGLNPRSVTVGDFNGDGRTDLAVANSGSNNIGILFGNGSGGFATAVTHDSGGSYPSSVTVGDFNGDGEDDLAVANSGSNNIGILLTNGSGGFATAVTRDSGGSGPTSVTVGDFNGDGKDDLAVANSGSNNVGVLWGDASGGFATAVTYASGGGCPYSVTVGDFNGDGKDDLAVANRYSHNIGVLLGNGSGGFAATVTYASGGLNPSSVTVGDFNGDGEDDLAVANSGSNNIGILFGNGSGGFATAVNHDSGGSYPSSVTVGDFNGDGKDDLTVANSRSNNIGILLTNGSGGFAATVTYVSGGWYPISVIAADFNSDGKDDLAVANYGSSNNIGVLLGNGSGGFATAISGDSGGLNPYSVTVADFNDDGKEDLATANSGSNNASVLLGASADSYWAVFALTSPHAMSFFVQTRGFGGGQLVDGTNNAFDGMNRLRVAGQYYAPRIRPNDLTDGNRSVVTPRLVLGGLYVHREITVPAIGDEAFARTVEVFSNPTDSPITTTVRIVGNLGSDDSTTVWKTSDGDSLVETTDQWIGTDDADGSGTPAIVHYIHGPEGLQPTSVRLSGDWGDNIEWTYNLTVPAGETVRLAHFTILAQTRALAEAAAGELVTIAGFGGEAAAFLTEPELTSVANFAFSANIANLSSGSLQIRDTAGAGQNDSLTIVRSSDSLLVSDSNNLLGAGSGTTQVDAHTVSLPLASITGSIQVSTLGGSDTLTIDFSGGNPLPPGGLTFIGGDGTGEQNDALVITHGSFTDVIKTLTGPHDGTIQLDDLPLITYTGLAPVDFIADEIGNLTVNLPAGADHAVVEDAGAVGDGLWRIRSTDVPVTFEQTTFPSPGSSLAINANGGDTVTVAGFDSLFSTPSITLAGSGGGNRFVLGAAERLPDGAALTLVGDTEFDLNGLTEAIGSLSDPVGGTLVSLGAGTLVTGGNHVSTMFAGTITGTGILTKTGNGVFRLAGAADVGAATVAAGTLLINGTLTAEQDVQVHSGGTLGGTGTIAASAGLLVSPGATLDPGELEPSTDAPLPGRLTVDANVRIEQGATFRVQLGGLNPGADGYDQLTLNGTIDLGSVPATPPTANGGTLNVSIVGGFTVPLGAAFRIIDNDGTELIGTRFDGLPEGGFLYPGGVLMNISYLSGLSDNDVTLTAPGRYDFNGFHGYTADTYMAISPFTRKGSGNSAGWVSLPPQYFERNLPAAPPYASNDGKLRYDGQATDNMGTPLTFEVDVEAGRSYDVMILTGDAGWNHDRQQFTVTGSGSGGSTSTQQLDTWGGGGADYRWLHFTTAVGGTLGSLGKLSMTMQDLGGADPAAVILAMDIRPMDAVGAITLTRTNPPGTDALSADGVTTDTYAGSGAPPNSVVTVTAASGSNPTRYLTIGSDLDAALFGAQVQSEGSGNFSFTVQRPAIAEPALIVAEESSGLSRGTFIQNFTQPTAANVARYDFGVYGSPVQKNPDFLEVVPQTIYSATRGYGWMSRVAGVNRKDPSMSELRTDLNYASNATFRVNVTAATEYHVRIYHANPKYYGSVPYIADNFDVWAEGLFQYNVPSVAAGSTEIREFTITPGVDGTAGTLEIRFWDRGGADGNFVVSGIEIWTGSETPPMAPLMAGEWAAGAERGCVGAMGEPAGVKLDATTLAPVVAEAAARWSAVGLTPAQSAALSEAQFVVADLGGSYLGLADIPAYRVWIDNDAAGRGWVMKDEGRGMKDESPERRTLNAGVDLLTVVMHEMGHLLGYGHSENADDLMTPVLGAGRRSAGSSAEAVEPLGRAEWRNGLSSLTRHPSPCVDDLFADLERTDPRAGGGSEADTSPLLERGHCDLVAVAASRSGEGAIQAWLPRRTRLQRYERDLDDCFAQFVAEEEAT